MTLGQTRWCCNRVTHGAPIHTHTHTQSPESPGQDVQEASLFGRLSLQPISQVLLSAMYVSMCVCVREREYGVTLHWLTSGVTELARERQREEGCLHLLTHTHTHSPWGYRLQPLFHLCLSDLPNDVFIYSVATHKHTRYLSHTCNQEGH